MSKKNKPDQTIELKHRDNVARSEIRVRVKPPMSRAEPGAPAPTGKSRHLHAFPVWPTIQ